jgi:hypothetical protein
MTAAFFYREAFFPRAFPAPATPACTPSTTARDRALLGRLGLVADPRDPAPDPLAWLSLSTDRVDDHLSDRIA